MIVPFLCEFIIPQYMEFVKQRSTICMDCKDIRVWEMPGIIFYISGKDAKRNRTGGKKISASYDFGVYYKRISGAVRVKISRKMLYTFGFL